MFVLTHRTPLRREKMTASNRAIFDLREESPEDESWPRKRRGPDRRARDRRKDDRRKSERRNIERRAKKRRLDRRTKDARPAGGESSLNHVLSREELETFQRLWNKHCH